MKDKKTIIIAVVILLLVLVGAVGASYAYFATVNKTTGNEKNLNIVTENLGDIEWEGTKVYTSGDLLPGECGIQTFTIEKNSATGKGIYEIDLKGILDESFGTDVEITLYKSTDTTTNNVTIKEGNSTISGDTTKQYYKEDSVVLNGTPEKVYGTKALQNKDQIILEQADFDNSTLSKTTYYLVYCYKNNGNQDAQQGKSFSGERSVRLILEKGSQQESVNAVQYVTTLAQTDTTNLATDDYGNTRYIGKNPNNYVSIDGDIWRVIGVMKSIDDGTGNKEDRVKLIRAESIGFYSWDTSDSSINSGLGVNEWSQADLMKLLNPGYENNMDIDSTIPEEYGGNDRILINNSLYWNSGSGNCFAGGYNHTEKCSYTKTGINEKLKTLIGDAVWNTGSSDEKTYVYYKLTPQKYYEAERSSNVGKICSKGNVCNDTVVRTTKWTGKIGLMYPSDYGYATSGGSTTDRATCLNTAIYGWDSSMPDCYNNNWLYKSDGNGIWTITPGASSTGANYAFGAARIIDLSEIDIQQDIYPVLHLKSNVKISSGTGSQDNPFVLES